MTDIQQEWGIFLIDAFGHKVFPKVPTIIVVASCTCHVVEQCLSLKRPLVLHTLITLCPIAST